MPIDKKYAVVLLIVALAVAAAVVWYLGGAMRPASLAPAAAPQSFGGEMYALASDPLQDKLPDANPMKNADPLQALKVNPF